MLGRAQRTRDSGGLERCFAPPRDVGHAEANFAEQTCELEAWLQVISRHDRGRALDEGDGGLEREPPPRVFGGARGDLDGSPGMLGARLEQVVSELDDVVRMPERVRDLQVKLCATCGRQVVMEGLRDQSVGECESSGRTLDEHAELDGDGEMIGHFVGRALRERGDRDRGELATDHGSHLEHRRQRRRQSTQVFADRRPDPCGDRDQTVAASARDYTQELGHEQRIAFAVAKYRFPRLRIERRR